MRLSRFVTIPIVVLAALAGVFLFVSVTFNNSAKAATQITAPPEAQAATQAEAFNPIGTVRTVFNVITDPKTHLANWTANIFVYTPPNAFVKFVCGGEKDLDMVFVDGEECLKDEEIDNIMGYVEKGRLPGGMAGIFALSTDRMLSEPEVPTNMALYINDLVGDTIFGTTAYAADLSKPDDYFEGITFAMWQVSRDISLAVAGVALSLAALMVVFRKKLNPQVVVSIYNVLPTIPIALIGIVLSYPLVALALNLSRPLVFLAVKLGLDVTAQMAYAQYQTYLTAQGSIKIWKLVATIFNLAFSSATGQLSIAVIFIALLAILLAVMLFIRVFYEYARYIITFIVIVVAMPIASAISIIPGQQGILYAVVKRLIVNILVFPFMIFFILVGLAIMSTAAAPTDIGSLSGLVRLILGYNLIIMLFKAYLGFIIAWKAMGVRKYLEQAFNIEGSMKAIFQTERAKR